MPPKMLSLHRTGFSTLTQPSKNRASLTSRKYALQMPDTVKGGDITVAVWCRKLGKE